MKTEALKLVIADSKRAGNLSLPREAEAELNALEESHAEMAKALKDVLDDGARYGEPHMSKCSDETQAMWCVEPCTSIRAALKKAGAL